MFPSPYFALMIDSFLSCTDLSDCQFSLPLTVSGLALAALQQPSIFKLPPILSKVKINWATAKQKNVCLWKKIAVAYTSPACAIAPCYVSWALFLRERVCLWRSGRLSGQVSTVKHTAEKIWSFKYCVKCANLTTVVKRPLFKSPREQAK